MNTEGIRQLIHWYDIGLVSMDPETGKKLWEQPFPKTSSQSTCRLHLDTLHFSGQVAG